MFINMEIERMRRQMKKTDLSSRIAVSVHTWDAWVSGRRPIPASKLRALSQLFGCSVDYLLKGGDTWNP